MPPAQSGTVNRRHHRATLFTVLGLICAGSLLPAAAAPKVHSVLIEAMKFSPQRLEVKAGDTIVWTNKDPFPHTATSDAPGFHSGNILPEQSWKFVARKKGAFPYSCALHETMKATLIVK